MSGNAEVMYALDFRTRRRKESHTNCSDPVGSPIPRIARLMALAIRFQRLVREETIRDYAELARRGRVTRARMTQIMKLLHLAPWRRRRDRAARSDAKRRSNRAMHERPSP